MLGLVAPAQASHCAAGISAIAECTRKLIVPPAAFIAGAEIVLKTNLPWRFRSRCQPYQTANCAVHDWDFQPDVQCRETAAIARYWQADRPHRVGAPDEDA
jgi:hypothetical protein